MPVQTALNEIQMQTKPRGTIIELSSLSPSSVSSSSSSSNKQNSVKCKQRRMQCSCARNTAAAVDVDAAAWHVTNAWQVLVRGQFWKLKELQCNTKGHRLRQQSAHFVQHAAYVGGFATEVKW